MARDTQPILFRSGPPDAGRPARAAEQRQPSGLPAAGTAGQAGPVERDRDGDPRRTRGVPRLARLAAGVCELAQCVADALAPQCCVGCHTPIPGGSGMLCDKCAATIDALRAMP